MEGQAKCLIRIQDPTSDILLAGGRGDDERSNKKDSTAAKYIMCTCTYIFFVYLFV